MSTEKMVFAESSGGAALPVLYTKFDALRELMDERRRSDVTAMALNATEMARRLDELNHERARERDQRSEFINREVFEAAVKELRALVESNVKELKVNIDRNHAEIRGIAERQYNELRAMHDRTKETNDSRFALISARINYGIGFCSCLAILIPLALKFFWH